MVPNETTLVSAALVLLGLFGFAFIAAPHSCEWGLKAYVWAGLATLLALVLLPWLFDAAATPGRRALFGLGLFAVGLLVWAGGLFAANFRLLCRLF